MVLMGVCEHDALNISELHALVRELFPKNTCRLGCFWANVDQRQRVVLDKENVNVTDLERSRNRERYYFHKTEAGSPVHCNPTVRLSHTNARIAVFTETRSAEFDLSSKINRHVHGILCYTCNGPPRFLSIIEFFVMDRVTDLKGTVEPDRHRGLTVSCL